MSEESIQRALDAKAAAEAVFSKGSVYPNKAGEAVFDEPPLLIVDKNGDPVGVDATVRLFDARGNEIRTDPHRVFINPPLMVPNGTEVVERALFGRTIKYTRNTFTLNPAEAYKRMLEESLFDVVAAKGFRTRGTVTTFYANSDDGWIDSSSATYATARSGGGSFYVGDPSEDLAIGQTTSAGVYFLDEGFVRFDTSTITDDDSIDQVDLSFWPTDLSFLWAVGNLEARSGYTYSGSGVTSADWQDGTEYSALTLVASLASGSISTGAYEALTENGTNFRSAINKTGYTELTLCFSTFASGTTPTDLGYVILARSETAGTTNDPKLVVTHTAAASAGHPAMARHKGVPGMVSRPAFGRGW